MTEPPFSFREDVNLVLANRGSSGRDEWLLVVSCGLFIGMDMENWDIVKKEI